MKMDVLNSTATESKATCDIIKNYISEKHSVKILSLYIAQTKRGKGLLKGTAIIR